MTKSLFLLALLPIVACSNPVEPRQRPAWADNTSWKGTVTMKSGTPFVVTFQLSTALGRPLGYTEWVITINQKRLENAVTGEVLTGDGDDDGYSFGTEQLGWVDLGFYRLGELDAPQVCPLGVRPQDRNVWYRIHTEIAADGTLQGAIEVSCRFSDGRPLESQPIVFRRI